MITADRALFACAFAAALFAAPLPLHAFEIAKTERGAPLILDGFALTYDVVFTLDDPAGEAFSAAARRAFDTWGTEAHGALQLRYAGTATRAVHGDGRSTVVLRAVWDPRDGDADRTIAVTPLVYDAFTGKITEADILLNAAAFHFGAGEPGMFDTESVILHEAGHALGFAHSCGDPGTTYPSCFQVPDTPPGNQDRILNAVMAPTLSPGTRRESLGGDDLDGLAAEYSVSSTITPPKPESMIRTCPDSQVYVSGRFTGASSLILRASDGDTALVPSTEELTGIHLSSFGRFSGKNRLDFIVRDPRTRAYGVLIAAEIPPPCVPIMRSDAGGGDGSGGPGCSCSSSGSTGRQTRGTLPIIVLALLGLTVRRRPKLILLIAAPILLLAGAHEALAYKCSRTGADLGPSLYWEKRSIPWWANAAVTDDIPDKDAALAALKRSFQTWEDVDCSDLTLPFQGAEDGLVAGFEENGGNKNVVVFIESGWKSDPAVIAVTTNAFDTRNGKIFDSDIEVNGEHFHFTIADQSCDPTTGVMDLENAITHEVGHVIGLDHPPATPRYQDDTMFASAPSCEIKKRTLAQDDIDGLCAIYPAGEPTKQCFPPNGPSFALVESHDGYGGCGCSHFPARGHPASALVLFLLGLILGGVRRRRR